MTMTTTSNTFCTTAPHHPAPPPPPTSGYLTAVPGAVLCGGAQRGRAYELGLFEQRGPCPLGGAVRAATAAAAAAAGRGVVGGVGGGGDGVGAAVHHAGVEAIGHGEGLEVGLQGRGQGQLLHQVDGRAGHDGAAAQLLEAQHWRVEHRRRWGG